MSTTSNATTHGKRPKVLIVGAGLGGLALGAILEKSDTPYEIFERAPQIKPLGSITSLTGAVAPLLKQLGIWEEFCSISRVMTTMQVRTAPTLETEFLVADVADPVKRYGAKARSLPRPVLYDFMLRQVPKEKVHFGKKVASTEQNHTGVRIKCVDGTEYTGDILVGADGAYSAVRHNLYAQLKKENKLPHGDSLPLPFLNVALLGQTRKLTLDEFPDLAKDECQFQNILSTDKPYSGSVCWAIYEYLSGESTQEDESFKNAEWGPKAAQEMCDKVRDFPVVSGGNKILTIGDLIDLTPKGFISKVMLEEKIFQTWHSGRTVIIGDAIHKLNPSGGSGAINALHDAIVLSNYIHALPDHPTLEQIEKSFITYKSERIEHVELAESASKAFRSMVDKGWTSTIVRFFMRNMPSWISGLVERRILSNRPQVYFLPRDTTPSEMPPAYQPSLQLRRPVAKAV
ncbi:hypothetical protein BGW39_008309 [Mortierella sp. 14UC]|nr:hypothetical protein BGW39_008309 [Mortierella sp. 14UC]